MMKLPKDIHPPLPHHASIFIHIKGLKIEFILFRKSPLSPLYQRGVFSAIIRAGWGISPVF
jgi:hypothetical protein